MLEGKTVVFGVTGCIAAYKAVDVVSRLRKLGANVFVIMTRNACKLVQPITFRTLSDNPVVTEMFDEPKQWNVEHIALAERADLFMVCPATANIIGKVASGIADDFLSTTIMATRAPVFFVPAMNNNMYENPVTQRNIAYLASLGHHFMEPDFGRLASGKLGKGRFPDAERIVREALAVVSPERPLSGKRVLVTAGPTREAFDPVWYLSNGSSGKMGISCAAEAGRMGADVTLVMGPSSLPVPSGVKVIRVTTTQEMHDRVVDAFKDQDLVIMAAAPVDYRPAVTADSKIKKTGEPMTITLVRNPDILLELGGMKTSQVLVGFAGETDNIISNARAKLSSKNADMFVANNAAMAMGSDEDAVTFIYPDGRVEEQETASKENVAREILTRAARLLEKR